MYLIQGVLFQNYTGLGIAMKPIEGAVAVVRTSLAHFFVFHGIIGRNPADPDGPLTGEVHDHFGEAELTEIEIHLGWFGFAKKYKDREDKIIYRFGSRHSGTFWEGEYRGEPHVGIGFARCVLVEVPDDFLVAPPKVIERAKQEYARATAREAAAQLAASGKIPGDINDEDLDDLA